MRFLLLGGTGQLGRAVRTLALPSAVTLSAPERSELDLCDRATLQRWISGTPWSVVINAAAFTDVDRSEREEDAAFAVNTQAALHVAEQTSKRGIPLIHISTDYVFDGRKGAPYVESDKAGPLNAYGRSKLAGEQAVLAANPRHIVLRTAWLFSPHGKNFVRSILDLARQQDRLNVVVDQKGSPTSASDLAEACLTIAFACSIAPDKARYGLYHFAGGGFATRFELAKAVIDAAADRIARRPEVLPVMTATDTNRAVRPADTRLDCEAIQEAFGVKPKPWPASLKETVDNLLSQRDVA